MPRAARVGASVAAARVSSIGTGRRRSGGYCRRSAVVELLALRHRVPDSTLLDAMELADWLPVLPARLSMRQLRAKWQISQPALCRRLQRLVAAGLLDCEKRWGAVLIRRIGPVSDTAVPLINESGCAAMDLAP